MASVKSTSPGFPRSISLPEANHHLMTSRWPSRAALRSGAYPYVVGSFTLTLESLSSSRTQEVAPWRQAKLKGVHPFLSFTLTSMSGCARINGITAELLSPQEAECSVVHPPPSSAMFTLKPGSCLISSDNFFTSSS